MTQFRFDVLRNGAPIAQLSAPKSAAPQIAFTATAEIKMTLSGEFHVPEAVNFISDIVRPVMEMNGKEYPLGRFLIPDPEQSYTAASNVFSLAGFDLTYMALMSAFESPPTYSAGLLYTAVIERLLVESGISNYYIEPSSATLQTTRTDWEAGATRISAINGLLTEINYKTIWCDKNGIVRAEPYLQPTAQNAAHFYGISHHALLQDLSKIKSTFNLPNVFKVYVDNPDFPQPMVAMAENNNPASPVSTIRRGMRVPLVQKLDNIASQQHLDAYVNNLALKNQVATETISFSTALEDLHGFGDVLVLYRQGVEGVFEETEWTLTAASTGAFEHTARRILYL